MSEVSKRRISNSEIADSSNEHLEACLRAYDVNRVSSVLGQIIKDRSIKGYERRKLVERVVEFQPHPTKEFTKYDKWNAKLYRDSDPGDVIPFLILSPLPILGLAISRGFYFVPEYVTWISGVFLAILVIGAFLVGKSSVLSHEKEYEERAKMSLKDFRAHKDEKEAISVFDKRVEIREQQFMLQHQLDQLSDKPSISFSLSGVKQEYQDAKARIASYEIDLDMALKYPAFNDISVPEVRNMVKQMRSCSKMFEHVGYHNLSEFSREVDELWVCIQSTEEAAKRIGLDALSAEELRLLNKIKGLAAHASDATYSDEVRGGFYRQLKTTIDRLNERRSVVPTKIVAEIEAKAALSIEEKKEPEHV